MSGTTKPETAAPAQSAPEWTQYVLSQFIDEELVDGNPIVDGLRRVTELLLGPILGERTEVIQCAADRVVVKGTVRLSQGEFDGTAEVNAQNCEPEFLIHAVNVGETRARGRAFRAALKLRKMLAAEEIYSRSSPMVVSKGLVRPKDEPIQPVQLTAIRLLAGRAKLNVTKVIAAAGVNKTDLNTLTFDEGTAVTQFLNSLQGSRKEIPPELLAEGGAKDA